MVRMAAIGLAALGLLVSSGRARADELAGLDDAAVIATTKALKVAPGETIIFLEDLHCDTCAKQVTSKLFKQKGVVRVRTSVKLDAAVVTPQAKKKLDAPAAWAALQAAGYQPTRLVGPEGVFVPNKETKEPLKIAEGPAPARQ